MWCLLSACAHQPEAVAAPVVAAPAPLVLSARRQLPVGSAELQLAESGLKSWILRPGSGPTPQHGQTVLVQYAGFMTDGSAVDSSLRRGEPLRFVLGEHRVIPGWELAVATMQLGELRKIQIPPALGYGEDGGGVMPANTTLIFDLELVGIE